MHGRKNSAILLYTETVFHISGNNMNLQGADSSAEKPTPSSIPGQKSTRSAINQHHKKPTKQLIQLQESPTANN
jgi:hypothetical protein